MSKNNTLTVGDEPTNLLLALLADPLADLIKRGVAVLALTEYQGEQALAIVLRGVKLTTEGVLRAKDE